MAVGRRCLKAGIIPGTPAQGAGADGPTWLHLLISGEAHMCVNGRARVVYEHTEV